LYVRIDEDTLDIEIDSEYEGWEGLLNMSHLFTKPSRSQVVERV
jgi:hypothetical protein